MKKLLISLLSVVALSASATQPVLNQFINGSGLVITNGITYTYNSTNMEVFGPLRYGGVYQGQPEIKFWSNATTNMVPTVVSNAVSGYAPGTLYWTNYALYSSATPATGGLIVNTNAKNGKAWVDVPVFCNGNGDVSQATLTVTTRADTAAQTNTLTMIFAPVYNDGCPVTANSAAGAAYVINQDYVGIVMKGNGVTAATVKTNIPSAVLTGAQQLRLVSVISSADSAPVIIDYITLSGWSKP
jgi:hypothetical protein